MWELINSVGRWRYQCSQGREDADFYQLIAINLSPPASPHRQKSLIKCFVAPRGKVLTEWENLACSSRGTALWGEKEWTCPKAAQFSTPAFQNQPGSPGILGEPRQPAHLPLSRGAHSFISTTCCMSKTKSVQHHFHHPGVCWVEGSENKS